MSITRNPAPDLVELGYTSTHPPSIAALSVASACPHAANRKIAGFSCDKTPPLAQRKTAPIRRERKATGRKAHIMGEFERQVRDIAVDRFGSIASFARKADVNYRTLATLFDRGNFANSRYETVSAVATALGVDADMLMQGKYVESPAGNPSFSLVPVCESICPDRLAHITANTPRYPVPDVLASRHPDSFLLHVPDTAMDRIIPKGSYALVTPTDTVAHSSQPYAVCIGEAKAVIRRAYALANGVRLEPDSADPTWHPTTHDFADEDSAPLTIVGRVIWYALPADWRF